jgi:hypothetical protein
LTQAFVALVSVQEGRTPNAMSNRNIRKASLIRFIGHLWVERVESERRFNRYIVSRVRQDSHSVKVAAPGGERGKSFREIPPPSPLTDSHARHIVHI